MSRLYSFPRWSTLLRPRSLTQPVIRPMILKGPPTFVGRSQIGGPSSGYWTMRGSWQLITSDQLLDWRGIVADMQGGLNPYIFGVFDERQAPTVEVGGPVYIDGIPHSDGSLFSDGSGYAQSTIEVELKNSIVAGATSAVFRVITAGPLKRGMYFSIDACLYMIAKPPEQDGNEVTVSFLPQARADALDGAWVEFANPVGLFRLSDQRSGAADLSGIYTGEPTLELEESFDGL